METIFNFLTKLKNHNDRDWFEDHRAEYEKAQKKIKALARKIETGLMEYDQLDLTRSKIYRIYNDVRFHKDKPPYKSHFSMSYSRLQPELRGGYYLHLSPGESFLAAGFWSPEPADLLHIRKQISQDPEPLRKVLDQKRFKEYFGELQGEKVKTSPKGFSIQDPANDLLRHKQLIVTHEFSDRECFKPDFDRMVVAGFKEVLPFYGYMTEILTTDLNGVSLI